MHKSRAYAFYRSRTPSFPSTSEHRESGSDGDYESDGEFPPVRGRPIPRDGYTQQRRFVVLNNDLPLGTRITIQRGQPPSNPSPPPPPPPPPRPHSRNNIHQFSYRTEFPLRGRPNYDPRSAIPDDGIDSAPPPASQQFHNSQNFYRYVPNPFSRAYPYSFSRPVSPGSPPSVRRYYGPFGRRPDSPPPPNTSWNLPRFHPNVYHDHGPYGHELRRRLSRGPGERSRPVIPDALNTRNTPYSGSDSESDSGSDCCNSCTNVGCRPSTPGR
ncbi:hypothetical protein RUND412_002494 [Rhizina undulata]